MFNFQQGIFNRELLRTACPRKAFHLKIEYSLLEIEHLSPPLF